MSSWIGPVAGSAILGLAGGAATWGWRHQHSAAVAAWAPSSGHHQRAGPLQVRTLGSAEPVVLLLHGMIAAGNSFGAAYDALAQHATVVVPDLLGFGGSMHTTGPIDARAHSAALDAALTALQLDNRPTIVAGHSMGGALALRWAAEHTDRVRSVVTFGAPLYRDRVEADQHVTRMGRMEAVLAGDGPLPRAVCAWMCRHRTAASWIAAGYRSDLPIPVARSGVKHTWNTYTGSMNGLIRDTGWQTALAVLSRAGTPVTLAAGDADPVPVSGRAAELARAWPNVEVLRHPYAD
ncbi:MAG: alpha/beta fold hydrolase, partial [Geodermatophilaceae bacterium]